MSCTGAGWVSAYLSEYSDCSYGDGTATIECKDGEWKQDVTPHGYSVVSNVYCREEPEGNILKIQRLMFLKVTKYSSIMRAVFINFACAATRGK